MYGDDPREEEKEIMAKKIKHKLSDEERRRKKKQDLITNAITYIGIAVWLGMAFGKASLEAETLMDAMTMFMGDFMSYLLMPFPTNFMFPAAALAVVAIIIVMDVDKYMRKKDVVDDPHGDAAFEDDFLNYDRQFVIDPAVVQAATGKKPETYYTNEHKKIVLKPEISNVRDAKGKFKDKTYQACWQKCQLYGEGVALSLNGTWCQRNSNAIIFGGSGAGKSRFFLMPNLLQANSNYVITDPSGEIMAGYGRFLEEQGYIVKCLNISQMTKSCRFNPLYYIRDASDIPIIVTTLMENTQKTQKAGGDDFWQKTTQALLCGIIGYLYEVEPVERRNFYNVLELLRMATAAESDEDAVTDFDLMFDALGKKNPNSYAYRQYQTYHLAPRKTANNILISTAVLISTYIDIPEFANMTYKDEMELDKFGAAPYKLRRDAALFPEDEERYAARYRSGKLKNGYIDVEDFRRYESLIERDDLGRYVEGEPYRVAIFLAIPTADTTYNWLTAMMYSLCFKLTYKRGETRQSEQMISGPALALHARFLIDEAANIGKIPNLQEYLATCRKYRISIVPIFQSFSQVTKVYGKEDANSIYANCDTTLFLGGVDPETIKIVTNRLGKETIKSMSSGTSGNSKSKSSSENIQSLARDLMSSTQIEQLDNDKCIVFIRGQKPFRVKKINLNNHPNYRYTQEADPKGHSFINPFVIEYDDSAIEAVRLKKIGEAGYTEPEEVQSARLVAAKEQARVERFELARSLVPAAPHYAVLEPGADKKAADAHNQYVQAFEKCAREAAEDGDIDTLEVLYPIVRDYGLNIGIEFPEEITNYTSPAERIIRSSREIKTREQYMEDAAAAEEKPKMATVEEIEKISTDDCVKDESYNPLSEFGRPSIEEAEEKLKGIFMLSGSLKKEKEAEIDNEQDIESLKEELIPEEDFGKEDISEIEVVSDSEEIDTNSIRTVENEDYDPFGDDEF